MNVCGLVYFDLVDISGDLGLSYLKFLCRESVVVKFVTLTSPGYNVKALEDYLINLIQEVVCMLN